MKTISIYLHFAGNCNEALDFYKDCFKGEILYKQTFGEAPMPSTEEQKNQIMHATFKAESIKFMASDGLEKGEATECKQVSLSINLEDEKEQEIIFNKLAKGGKITMPLQDTFWGAKFGMVTDKFGINCMTNMEKKK